MKRATIAEICAGVGLFAAIGAFHEEMMGMALVAAGRSAHCSSGLAVRSVGVSAARHQRHKEITAASRMVEKDGAGFELWDTPSGRFWIPPGTANEVFYDLAEQQGDLYDYHGRGLRAGDIVLDAGASVGVYTRKALNGGAKKVVAIEPAPDNLRCLEKTFAREIQEGRVIVYPKGVWDKDDVLAMNLDPTNSAGHSFVLERKGAHTVNLPLTTIDRMVEELKLERVDFIKFDIEGAERKALAGGARTLAAFRPRMAVCVYHLPDDPEALPKAARAAYPGYQYECGPCVVSQSYIVPEVFFFY